MRIYKYATSEKVDYELEFHMKNGHYIDEGSVALRMIINADKWEAKRNGTSIKIMPSATNLNAQNETKKVRALYRQEKIMKTVEEKIIELDNISLNLDYDV